MHTPLRLAGISAAMILSVGLAAAQPARPAPTAPAAQEPVYSASHLAVAREVAVASGITRSLDVVAPQLMDKLRDQAVTRPDLTKDLNEVLNALHPETDLLKQQMLGTVARILAARMSETELTDVANFFKSPSGRKYVESQPQVLDDFVREMELWSHDVAEYLMVRVRAEMGKRGHQLQ
jgi:uncharacterized protein